MTNSKKMLGERLRIAREKMGLKQNRVALSLGIHNSTLAKYESGEREADIDTLNKLAKIYDLKVDYLITGDEVILDDPFAGSREEVWVFSEILTKLRKSKKITQENMAKIIGVARTTYGMYEQGQRHPDYETIQKIADFFDVTVDYLLGRSDNAVTSPSNDDEEYDYRNDPTVTGELREFLDDLSKLPPEEQEEIINMAKTFVAGLKTRNRPTR